jgi:hypothetical protein
MAAFSVKVVASAVRSPRTGLRPEPQGVRTPAAGAALKTGAAARSRPPYRKSVFDRHSTQSLIAATLRREPEIFKELAVDRTVYRDANPIDESQAARRQASEYTAFAMYTARTPAESFRRV